MEKLKYHSEFQKNAALCLVTLCVGDYRDEKADQLLFKLKFLPHLLASKTLEVTLSCRENVTSDNLSQECIGKYHSCQPTVKVVA